MTWCVWWWIESKPQVVRERASLQHSSLTDHHLNMSSGGAYGASRAQDTDFRKKWDKEEYAEKAKKKDEEERERMKENEERLKQGIETSDFITG